jgi:uncharacterized protein
VKYRELGATGLSVSEISLGCEGFVQNEGAFTLSLMDEAEKAGINFIDLYTSNPDVRSRVGQALKGKRKKFILQSHICTTWVDGQYKRTRDIEEVKASFEDMLERLSTDYIDVGMIHYVDAMDDWREVINGPVMKYALELKAAGRIKHIGLSSHNPVVALEAVNSGLIEVLMFSINPCYDLMPADEDCMVLFDNKNYDKNFLNMDKDREALYEACNRLRVGISVMKVFAGGDLLSVEDSPVGKSLTVDQCIHYALTRPGVSTVLAGAHTVEELLTSLKYEQATDEEKDYAAALASFPKISWQGHCMYCGHCAPCVAGIDIANVTKFLNLARAQGSVPETVREHYAALPHSGGECIECGDCEGRCPFSVPVRENMKKASEVFGK